MVTLYAKSHHTIYFLPHRDYPSSLYTGRTSNPQTVHPKGLCLANNSIFFCVGNIFSIFLSTSIGFTLCSVRGTLTSCWTFLAPLGLGIRPFLKIRHSSQFESEY